MDGKINGPRDTTNDVRGVTRTILVPDLVAGPVSDGPSDQVENEAPAPPPRSPRSAALLARAGMGGTAHSAPAAISHPITSRSESPDTINSTPETDSRATSGEHSGWSQALQPVRAGQFR